MTITTRWWWIRHAPVINHGGRIYGRTDVDADTSDTRLCQALVAALPVAPVWVATPLRRTTQTLTALLAHRNGTHNSSPQIEPDLMEQDFGAWTGLTFAEVAQQRGAESHRFWVSPARECPQDGESFLQVVDRVAASTTRLSAEHAGQDIVAVAHGGSIRAALAIALGIDPEAALRFSVHNLSLTRIDHIAPKGNTAPVWRIESVNHLF